MESFGKQNHESLVTNPSGKKRNLGRTQRHRHRRKEEEKRPYTVDSSDGLVTLCKWLRQKGMTKECKMRAVMFPDTGRGLMAGEKVRSGDVVVSIPREVLITCDDIINKEQVGIIIRKSGRKLKAMEVLALFLVHHKFLDQGSAWKPYIDSLPTSYTVPLYCSANELVFLPQFLKAFVDQQMDDVSTCYQNVKEILMESLGSDINIDMDDIKWGWFTVNTRAVYLRNESPDPLLLDEDVCALAPYLDLLNHTPSAEVNTGLNKENGCYEIVTQIPYEKFEQVFINYGPHDNVKLYTEYGFIISNNPHDVIPVTLAEIKHSLKEVCSEDIIRCEMYNKCKILKNYELDQGLAVSCEGPTWSLVVATTILLMTSEELTRWQFVYDNHEDIKNRELVVKVLDQVIFSKLQQLSQCFADMKSVLNCSESFAVATSLVRGLCNLLSLAANKKI